MKTKLRNRILALSLVVVMLLSALPLSVLAAVSDELLGTYDSSIEDEGGNDSPFTPIFGEDDLVGFPNTFRSVTTPAELEAALADDIDAICIAADFALDRTFYVWSDTIIYSETAITLTRSPEFAGDVFVVGQDNEGNFCTETVTLSIGGFNGDTSGGLTINGNSENMTVDVVGTIFFVCTKAQADFYDNLTVTNCKKVGNERSYNEAYGIASGNTKNLGGAVAIFLEKSFANIYGGTYTNNSVNTTGSYSIYGGAFYSYATMSVYGGLFEGNSANRAGAIYCYRTLNIYSAVIKNNTASTNGGAIYLPSSASAKLFLGGNSEVVTSYVLFSGNTAASNGGAICASGRISGQDATFENNSATNGGAIYLTGDYTALNISNSEFKGNSASTNGGAIFANSHNDLKIDNDVALLGVSLEGNSAKTGGTIYLNTEAVASIKSCSFKGNTASSYAGAIYATGATLEINKAEIVENSASYGAGLYLYEASVAVINQLDARNNTATNGGGVIYNTNSTLTVYNSNFYGNRGTEGSAICLKAGSIASIYGSTFTANVNHETNASNAGALYIYTSAATNILVHSCSFVQNSSAGLGGAILANGQAIVELYNITALENSAMKGGFLYETTSGTKVTISGLTVSGNTASVGGPIIWGNTANAKLFINKSNYVDLDVAGELPSDYWSGAIVNKLTVSTITTSIPAYTDYSGEIVEGLWSAVIVTNFEQLKAAVESGAPYIKLVNDIEISETLYITASTVIFSSLPCYITRAEGFKGSIFVIGRGADGVATDERVTLTLGLPTSATKDYLVFECGEGDASAIVVAGGSQINIYDNATIRGAIGADGCVITVEENAIANFFGGKIENNVSTARGIISNRGEINVEGGIFSANSAEIGGVIYNEGVLNILGGTFTENTAELGGAVYNVGELTISGGSISGNSATVAGAIYMANGTATISSEISENTAVFGGAIYAQAGAVTIVGATFKGNSATNGGAICLNNNVATIALVGATFNGNSAELGGALYLTGADFDVNDCVFIGNTATSGGAIYTENGSLTVSGCTLSANSATNGGAIYSNGVPVILSGITATENKATANGGVIYANAATVSMSANIFSNNEADKGAAAYVIEGTLSSANDVFELGYAFEGGAIYAERSELLVNASEFTSNDADYNGGAIALLGSNAYINNISKFTANDAANNGGAISAKSSKLTVYGAYFNSNTANLNGGAIAIASGAEAKIYTSVFNANTSKKNGGAIYATDENTMLTVQLCEFTNNKATGLGGAVALHSKATANVYSIQASSNSATRGGFLYITGADTTVTIIDATVASNTPSNGSFVYGDTATSILNINKSSYFDTTTSDLNAKYWEAALYGTLKINTIYTDVPEYIEEGNEPAGDLSGAFDVSSAEELEAALAAGRKNIRIVSDFEIDRTFYIPYTVTIFSTARHTLTRAPGFGGDIFVIGEYADGTNSMLKKADARLILGNPNSTTSSLLTIDGNKDNMTVDVVGSVLFICNGAVADVHENITITNCHKVGNEKAHGEHYKLSRPNRVGGSVAIVAFGSLNVYGGNFTNNSIREEDSSTEEGRNSTNGGVFYNEGSIKIYGGVFENNVGARGGIVYNYGTIKIYGGSFISNHATVGGGVYYSPNASGTQVNIGYNSTTPILFKGNTAQSSGGAIYSTFLNGMVIYGNTTFEDNRAISGNGGAIYTSSTFTIMNTVFSGNTAKSRGGAIYVTKSSDNYTTRFVRLDNCTLIGNSADTGGAISLYSGDTDYEFGSIVTTNDCLFVSNTAEFGGAISTERKSNLTINGTTFEANTATAEAGSVYVVGESTASINNSKITSSTANSHGGAISVRSSTLNIDSTIIENCYSDTNGGAIYIAYTSSIDRNAKVNITNSTLNGNKADNGGAIYATRRAIENDTAVLTVSTTDFANNTAKKLGGAVLLTAGVDVLMRNVTFVANASTSTSEGDGAAISALNCTLEIDGGVFTKNTSKHNGGAINIANASKVTLNNITASRNSARLGGGFIHSESGVLTIYNSTMNNNTANAGSAIYLATDAVTNIYKSNFISNACNESNSGNAGALYIYTGATKTVVHSCSFVKNTSAGLGGAILANGGAIVELYNITATENSALKGGFMYHTVAGTEVTLSGLTVSGNTASVGGPIIWGNTKNAILNIDKSKYTDLDATSALDDAYWASAIANLLTVNNVTVTVPKAATYTTYVAPVKNTAGKASTSVNEIFDLALNSSDGYINATYDKFPVLDNSSNFMSRGTTFFENINGGTVSVVTYVFPKYSTAHNMTVGEALMIYQAMLYKQAFPEEEVYIDISAYRFSVQTAININRDSRYFGYARSLPDQNYDEFGFVRVAYLLVSAAKMGIHVNVLGHREGYPVNSGSIPGTFESYFSAFYNDYCDPAYEPYGLISDYLTYCYFDWTLSEGNKGGTDMMHTKLCAVSHYLDMNGVIHRNAVWTSSSNLDGIYGGGYNANWKLQTATIISDHEDIYRISVNYLRLMLEYSDQEGIVEFQNYMNVETTKQIDLILAGKGDQIPENERLVYIGTETDDVFEMYFTPFGGDILSWSEIYNPYCKYLRKLYDSEDYIIFTWNAAEYSGGFPLAQQMEKMIIDAFHNNKNPNNKIYANMESFDPTTFDDLVVGVDIGFKSINEWPLGAIHNKDLQFSYVENGQRYYVSLLNSCNLHGGSMYYQSNSALVIKETTCSENSVFSIIAKYSTNTDLVTHTFTETARTEATETEHGYIYKVCSCCGHSEIIQTLHVGGEWIIEKIATPTENGIRYKKCIICDEIIETEETKYNGSYLDPNSITGTGFTQNTILPIYVSKTPRTIEATILLDSSISGRGGVIVGNYASVEDENAFNLEIFTDGKVRLFYITNGIRTDIVFNVDIRSTEPVHIAVTVDGENAMLYVNSILMQSVEVNNPLPAIDKDMMIGGDNRTVNHQIFKGKIYSVVLFEDARSADEIVADMQYVSPTAPDVLCSKYFTAADEMIYLADCNKNTGSKFTAKELYEVEIKESTVNTIEMTIMIPTTYNDRAGVIFGNYTDGTKDTVNIEVMAEGKLRLYYVANGIKYSYNFTTDIRSDKPINVAIAIDDAQSAAHLYINGILAESIALDGALPIISGNFAIGGDYRTDNVQYFKGTIYSVHVFSDTRSADEIISDMLAVNSDTEGLISSTYFMSQKTTAEANNGITFNNNVIGSTTCDLGSTPLTFEAVIKLSPDHTDRGGIIVSNNFKNKAIVSFEVFKNGKLRLYFVNGDTTVDCKFDTDVRSDAPIHVALSVDGTTASLYINGVLTEVKELALPLPTSTSGYHVGGDFRPGNTQYFKGTIYSVGLYDHARSAEQIREDMLSFSDAGLLFSANYFNTVIKTEAETHGNVKFEVITEPDANNDGLGKLSCDCCGKVLSLCSIPYTSETVSNNQLSDTSGALKNGTYYIVEDSFASAPKTFEFLLKLSPNITDRGGVVFGNYDGTANNRMNIEIYTNGNPRLWYKINGTSYSYLFDVDVRSEKAVHMTITIDGLSASLYINGTLIETVTLAAAVPYDGSLFYAATDQRISAQPFKGELYSVGVFADVRTPEEIANDMILVTSDAHELLFYEHFVATEGIQAKGPWADKTAIFVGDSITAGTNCEGDTYWQLLKEILELRSGEAMATPGSCISSTSDYGNEYDPLINRYDDIPEADLITIFMGTNDYGHDTPLGTIDDMTDVSFYGALNVIIPALQAKYPNATIVFITPLHRYGFGTNSATGEEHTYDSVANGAGHTLEDYANAIKEVCEKYGVSVIDLYVDFELDPSAEETREYYMEDGLHPNTAGHRLIAEYLEHAIKLLAPSNEQ